MLDILPLEIIYYILNFLPREDKFNCRKVCTLFRDYYPLYVEMKYVSNDTLIRREKNFSSYLNDIYSNYFSQFSCIDILNMVSSAINYRNIAFFQWLIDNNVYFNKLNFLKIDASKLIKFYKKNSFEKVNMTSMIYTLMNIQIDISEKKFIFLSYKFIYRYYDILVNSRNIEIFKSYVDCNDKPFTTRQVGHPNS